MDKKTIILGASIFVLLIIGMFGFAYLNKSVPETTPTVSSETKNEEENMYPEVTRIDAKQFYENGLHTFVGQIDLPTPCDLLETAAVVKESMPEQIQLNFTVINSSEACIQVVTPQRFQITASASESAAVVATFMGRPVTLNLIPAAAGESPADFELFIKG